MAKDLQIFFDGVDVWRSMTRQQLAGLDEAIDRAFRRFSETLEQRIQANILEQGLVETNAMMQSVEVEILGLTDVTWEGEVRVAVPYATVHEYGGVIRKDEGYMVFPSEDSNEYVFAKQVVIPARPFMRPAVDACKNLISQYIFEELQKLGLLT